MLKLKIVLISWLILLGISSSMAQTTVELKEFRLISRTGEISGIDGILREKEFLGTDENGDSIVIPRNEIRGLYNINGNHAGQYAAKGVGIGLVSGLLGVLMAYNDSASNPYTEVKEDRIVPVVVGFAAVGGIIGGLIGSGKEKSDRIPVRATLGTTKKADGVSLVMSFPF